MGQGGFIAIANATKYDMQNTYNHSYQMNSWSFPQTIKAGTCASVYIEWDQYIFDNQNDDSGEQNYTFNGKTFQIQARATNGFNMAVQLLNFGTQTVPQGATINLGWNHDGYVTFIISGDGNNLTSTNLSGPWMHNNLSILGNRSLMNLCIPGSHDAGMSQFNGSTAGAFQCNTITQTATILGQLMMGSRYFDIRPVISGGQYYTGHYSQIGPSWQGANGESIAQIISDVNSFTAQNKELVILDFSHDLNTDLGNSSYAPFTQAEWNSLFTMLQGINNLYIAPSYSAAMNLTNSTLNSFIGNNQAAVVLIIDPSGSGISLGNYAGNGFYTTSNFNIYNSYSDSNDLSTMANDQINKMKTQRGANPSYFLLSWTLTQSATQASTCMLGASSILALAGTANPPLTYMLFPNVTQSCYPNIVYTDNISGPNVAAIAMAINCVAIG